MNVSKYYKNTKKDRKPTFCFLENDTLGENLKIQRKIEQMLLFPGRRHVRRKFKNATRENICIFSL